LRGKQKVGREAEKGGGKKRRWEGEVNRGIDHLQSNGLRKRGRPTRKRGKSEEEKEGSRGREQKHKESLRVIRNQKKERLLRKKEEERGEKNCEEGRGGPRKNFNFPRENPR